MADGCRRMWYGCVVVLERGETGDRMAESRSFVGARTRLRLPKLLKVELGEDPMEDMEDGVGEVMLLEGALVDRWSGLWLKMV